MEINNSKEVNPRILSKEHLDMVHSFKDQVKPLRICLNDILSKIPCMNEPRTRQALLDFICNGIVYRGNGFLKQYRPLPVLGARILGSDSDIDFKSLGFEVASGGFPKHFAPLFDRLRLFRNKYISMARTGTLHYLRDSNGEVTMGSVIKEQDRKELQLIMSILSFSRFIVLKLSEERKTEELLKFKQRITKVVEPHEYYAYEIASGALLRQMENHWPSDPSLFAELELDLSQRGYKKDRPRGVPRHTLPDALRIIADHHINGFFLDDSPIAKATVLTEPGGKTRVISDYNGLVSSSNLESKTDSILKMFSKEGNDFKFNHELGRQKARRLSADMVKTFGSPTETNRNKQQTALKEQEETLLVSADLEAFTDSIVPGAIQVVFDFLNANSMIGVAYQPIYISDEVVSPQRLLMGFKGTFESATILHHCLVRSCLTPTKRKLDHTFGKAEGRVINTFPQYAMVGDDLCAHMTDGQLRHYVEMARGIGLKLQMTKTIISDSVSTFCGKYYFFGSDISPICINMHKLSMHDQITFNVAIGTTVSEARKLGSNMISAIRKVCAYFYGIRFRGRPMPSALPAKLGGLDFLGRRLIDVIRRKSFTPYIRVPDDEDPLDKFREYTRDFRIPWEHKDYKPLFYFAYPLSRGPTMKKVVKKSSKYLKVANNLLKGLLQILTYFYKDLLSEDLNDYVLRSGFYLEFENLVLLD